VPLPVIALVAALLSAALVTAVYLLFW
jgi:hypothetical protein